MNIAKYGGYFHDGALIIIQHFGNNIEFSMWSAEMDPEDMKDNIPLSSDDRLKGKLHVEGIKSIKINNQIFSGTLKLMYDKGSIFDLEIKNGKVELQIIWETFRPKPKEEGFCTIEIEAEKIYWEPIPDLINPFCRLL